MSVLKKPVLILNKNWDIIRISSFENVISKVFSGNMKIVDGYTFIVYTWNEWIKNFTIPKDSDTKYDYILTKDNRIRFPKVFICTKYNKMPKKELKINRKNIWIRDKKTCCYCGDKISFSEMTLDHIVPKSKNGKTTWENVVCCCKKINTKKRNRTPEEAGLKLLYHPYKPKWNPLFSFLLPDDYDPEWLNFIKK